MERERFEEIMAADYPFEKSEENNVLAGLKIIAKYLPKSGVEGADHDIIYSVDVDELLEAGITEADAIELGKLNWMIHNDEYLAHFV